MKVAILTYSHESNCGAVLQAWALRTVLLRFGYEVDMPVVKGYKNKGRIYNLCRSKSFFDLLKSVVYMFFTIGVKEWVDNRFSCAIKKIFTPLEITAKELSRYDFLIVGSDQVWNPDMGIYKLPLYLGEVIPKEIPIIGYAVSMGDSEPDMCHANKYLRAVKRFSNVFVREKIVSDYLCRIGAGCYEQVLDPALLLSIENYMPLEEHVAISEPYVFFYVMAANEVRRLVPDILRAVGVRIAVYYDGSIDFVPHKKPSHYRRFISPGQMISLVKNARAVVSCSFHGTAFSILANKPFIALTTKPYSEKFNTRTGDLLSRIGACKKMFSVYESEKEMCQEIIRPIGEEVQNRLKECREDSLLRLTKAISGITGKG